MRRRGLLLGAVLVGLALVAGVAATGWLLSDSITPANASRIKEGMSLDEVNRLLGQQGRPAEERLPGAAGENHYVWGGSLGVIHVAFRGDLTATDPAQFTATDSFRAHLRRLLPW
jgi:hypothetical protein